MGHWLVYLQLVKMLLPKTVEDDWFLFMLALTQVIVGGFLPGEWMGFVLILWGLVALWTLRLFHLRREATRAAAEPALASDYTSNPYPDLVDRAFLASAVKVAFLTLVLGGVIFLLLPRTSSLRQDRFRPAPMTHHLTGFTDSVRLGRMGEILENDTVVMSVELYDEQDNRIEPPTEALWRGVSLQRYEKGSWYRTRTWELELDERVPRPFPTAHPNRQVYKLEQLDSDVLFSLRPVLWAEGPDIALNRNDGTLFRSDLRPSKAYVARLNRHPGAFTYTVYGTRDPATVQPFEVYPRPNVLANDLLEVPNGLKPRLQKLLDTILAHAPDDPIRRAEILESYLRDGPYRYSLNMSVVNPAIDPVEDFLFNRREGHCEYFASALALMLRTAHIPARLVNGFKGGDWNPLARILYVRQKYAHSWVEALVGRDAFGLPIWKVLDPTPARQRDELIAQVGGLSSRLHLATDFIRYIWVFYVVGFDSMRQERLIYGPIKALFTEAAHGFALIAGMLLALLWWLVDFPTARSFFSVRGFSFTVIVLLALAAAIPFLRWLGRRLLPWWRRTDGDADDRASGVAVYRRLTTLLAALDLKRQPAETPREFARRAAVVLAGRGG